jgi:sugar/nucleoside kinase (ribokinase family)
MLSLLEGADDTGALRFACTAAALSATRPGAQTACPTRREVEDLLAGDVT